jgi:hypothetical protein
VLRSGSASPQLVGEYLVARLSDLVSLSFNAISIAAAPARVAGLELLVDVLRVPLSFFYLCAFSPTARVLRLASF